MQHYWPLPWEHISIDAPDGSKAVINATPARHGLSGSEQLQGDVIGFVIQVSGKKNYEVYITGDTVFYEGIVEVANRFNPQYVFVFAGAAKPLGPFNVSMGFNDAIDTSFAFPNARIIPLHHEGWSHYTENAATLTDAFSVIGIPEHLILLEPGKATILPV